MKNHKVGQDCKKVKPFDWTTVYLLIGLVGVVWLTIQGYLLGLDS